VKFDCCLMGGDDWRLEMVVMEVYGVVRLKKKSAASYCVPFPSFFFFDFFFLCVCKSF
jgi:hypothetical protein